MSSLVEVREYQNQLKEFQEKREGCKMPVTDCEEHDVKIETQSSDALCMPPKKRHLFRLQSMNSSSLPLNGSVGESQPQSSMSVSEPEHVLTSKVVSSGSSSEGKPSDEVKGGLSDNQAASVDVFPDSVRGQLCVATTVASTPVIDDVKCDVNNENIDKGGKVPIPSLEIELKPAHEELNQLPVLKAPAHEELNQVPVLKAIGERIPSDKSAFRKVEGSILNDVTRALPAPSDCDKGIIVKQETLDTCLGDAGFLKDPSKVNCKVEEFNSAKLQSNRSNWDLNTMMDSWEGSPLIASRDYGKGEKRDQIMRDNGKKEIGSLGNVFHEQYHPGSHLNLELSSSSDVNLLNESGASQHLIMPLTFNNVSDLSFSIVPSIGGERSNITFSAAIKPEPHHVEGVPQSLGYKAIKSEPFREIVEDHSSFQLPGNLGIQNMPFILSAKEELEVETQDHAPLRGIGTVDDKASSSGCANDNGPESNENAGSLSCSANQASNDDNDHRHQDQFSSLRCTSQVSAISAESSKASLSELQVTDNHESNKNLGSGELIEKSDAANSMEVVENHFEFDSTGLDSTLPNIQNPQLAINVTPSIALENMVGSDDKPNVCGDAFSMPLVSTKILDKVVSEMTVRTSSLDCKPASDIGQAGSVSVLESSLQLAKYEDKNISSKIALLEKSDVEMNDNEGPPHVDVTPRIFEGSNLLQSPGKPQVVVAASKSKSKHGVDDDDIEDGEVRDLLAQQNAIVSLSEGKEIGQNCIEEPGDLADDVVSLSPTLLNGEMEIGVNSLEEGAQSQLPLELTSNSCVENTEKTAGTLADVLNPSSEANPDDNLNRSNTVRVRDDLNNEIEKQDETKQQSLSPSGNYKTHIDGAFEVVSCVKEVQSSLFQTSDISCQPKVRSAEQGTNPKNVPGSGSHSHVVHLIPDSKISTVFEKVAGKKHFLPHMDRERSYDKSSQGDTLHRQGTRDERILNELRQFGREGKKEVSEEDMESDLARNRRRVDKKFGILRRDWNVDDDFATERFRRSNSHRFVKPRTSSEVAFPAGDVPVEHASSSIRNPPMAEGMDSFSHVTHRRRSPGMRDHPLNVGVQIIRRPMRDVSPGRHADGVSDLLLVGREERYMAGDVIDPQMVRTSLNSDREENFILRGRSVSPPMMRRGPPRLSRMRSPSSTRRARSPHRWSPQRSLDGFNMRREAVRNRSPPNVHVVRMRSPPNPRDCYIEGIPGGRCGSPPMPRLRDNIRDLGPPREFEYVTGGAPMQRNVRRVRLIDARANGEERFGLVHSRPRIHELLEDESFSDRRGAGHERRVIRPLRHRFADAGEEDLDFQLEHEAPRPMRLRIGDEEEFLERGRPRGGGIRSRLGELPRRLRDVEEREDTRTWQDADFDDVRLKRRRF